MDHFGIGQAIEGCANIYFRSARRTGRTTALLNNVKDGDRVVFINQRQADSFRIEMIKRKLDVECIVMGTNDIEYITHRSRSKGRTIFDHCWVEEYYMQSIKSIQKSLNFFEEISSSPGLDKETGFIQEEHYKWRV